MRVHRARPAAIGLATATLALAAAGLAVGGGTLGGFNGLDRSASAGDAFQLISLLATTGVGLIVALRRPTNPIGWIFSSLALFTALYLAAGSYAIPGRGPLAGLAPRWRVGRLVPQLGRPIVIGARPAGVPAVPDRSACLSAVAVGARRCRHSWRLASRAERS